MANDIADAESIDDDEYYDDEEDDEEEDLLFGMIPRTPGYIMIGAVVLVVLILLAALFSPVFGFRSGISSLTVNINNSEGDLLDTELEIEAYTGTPAFGSNANGDGDLRILFDGEEIYTATFKFTDGRGTKIIPYEDFYVDNGEYRAEIDFEGETEFDTVTLRRTAHTIFISQASWTEGEVGSDEEKEKVRYKMSLFPDEDSIGNYDALYIPGEGRIEVIYVPNENDQDDPEQWQNVTAINIETDFRSFKYKFTNGGTETELDVDKGYYIDFESSKIKEEHGDGYYSVIAYFTNTYGKSENRFTGNINAMPEDSGENQKWIYLED